MAAETMLDKIQGMLDRANHPNTSPEERAVCLKKADAFMARHQVDEAMLNMRRGDKEPKRSALSNTIAFVPKNADYWQLLGNIVSSLSALAGVRVCINTYHKSKITELTVIGMSDDVQYFRMLWLNAYMTYSAKLFPKWEGDKSLGWNIKAQKDAGVKWGVIYDIAFNNGWDAIRPIGIIDPFVDTIEYSFVDPTLMNMTKVSRPPNDGGYLKKMYEKECRHQGVDSTGHTTKNAAYRESYAMAFASEVAVRCWELMAARKNLEHGTPGATVALRDSRFLVDELFNKMFPETGKVAGYERQHEMEIGGTAAGIRAAKEVSMMQDRNNVRNQRSELT